MPPFYYISYAILWTLVILQGAVLIGILRLVYQMRQADISANSNTIGLKSGQKAPTFTGTDLNGVSISSRDLSGRPNALLFISSSCPSCMATLYDMESVSKKAQGNVTLVCRSSHEECVQITSAHKLAARTIVDDDQHISRLFGISTTPTAVLIDSRGLIESYGKPLQSEDLEMVLDGRAESSAEVNANGRE